MSEHDRIDVSAEIDVKNQCFAQGYYLPLLEFSWDKFQISSKSM